MIRGLSEALLAPKYKTIHLKVGSLWWEVLLVKEGMLFSSKNARLLNYQVCYASYSPAIEDQNDFYPNNYTYTAADA